jgi:hypothetical protein
MLLIDPGSVAYVHHSALNQPVTDQAAGGHALDRAAEFDVTAAVPVIRACFDFYLNSNDRLIVPQEAVHLDKGSDTGPSVFLVDPGLFGYVDPMAAHDPHPDQPLIGKALDYSSKLDPSPVVRPGLDLDPRGDDGSVAANKAVHFYKCPDARRSLLLVDLGRLGDVDPARANDPQSDKPAIGQAFDGSSKLDRSLVLSRNGANRK